jgi:diguanylate cyclase (GGDEF)-like protein
MSALSNLDEANRKAFAMLRDPASDASALLLQLLTTSCLLELRRLMTAGLDLSSFAVATVDTVARLAPIDHCMIELTLRGAPPVEYGVGVPDARSIGGASGLVSCVLSSDGTDVGLLRATGVPQAVVGAQLIELVADEISSGLAALAQREAQRRSAAEGTVLSLVASLDERYDVTTLQAFGQSLAALPGISGVSLFMSNERFGGPIVVDEGAEAEMGPTGSFEYLVDDRVHITLSVRWLAEPDAADEKRLRDIVSTAMIAIERVEANLRLAEEAEVDELTRVGNRRAGLRALKAAWDWARRNDEPMSVLLFDLDLFKKVNDTLGHDTGDAVLRAFAMLLDSSTRAYDRVIRWGGEEFLVVLPGVGPEMALTIADRLRESVPEACAPSVPEGWEQTVSVGCASYPDHADDPSRLVRIADEALYDAKAAGRNTAVVAAAVAPAR